MRFHFQPSDPYLIARKNVLFLLSKNQRFLEFLLPDLKRFIRHKFCIWISSIFLWFFICCFCWYLIKSNTALLNSPIGVFLIYCRLACSFYYFFILFNFRLDVKLLRKISLFDSFTCCIFMSSWRVKVRNKVNFFFILVFVEWLENYILPSKRILL